MIPGSSAARARALSRALDRELAQARARDLGWELERDLPLVLDHAYALARALAQEDGEDCLAQAEELVRALARARNLACSRPRARNLVRTLDRYRVRARALERDLGRGGVATRGRHRGRSPGSVDRGGDPAAAHTRGGSPVVGRVAHGLVALAVRVLPAPARGRYRAEFRAELHDLGSRWRQMTYAVRVLSRAGKLRRELIEYRPRPTDPSAPDATQW
ncbi:MAG TPA: hypothetical protein VFQ77_04920 [Pseudonocardiaceae bacterium]|nr:hypothetical protein [Pseudonocardiaceae bacterium]